MSMHDIKSKIERALRNDTGATFTFEQLRELCGIGFLHQLALREANEICLSVGVTPPSRADLVETLDRREKNNDGASENPAG